VLDSRHVIGQSARVPNRWDQIDALAFESVGEASSDGVEPARVIGLIDYVDRTVLTREEMERTLQRLLGSGLVEETNHRFRRTAAGQELHSACPSTLPRDRAPWIESRLRDRINCQPAADWSLAAAEFDFAVNAYHEEMRRLTERDT
jgi:hypothetical protein